MLVERLQKIAAGAIVFAAFCFVVDEITSGVVNDVIVVTGWLSLLASCCLVVASARIAYTDWKSETAKPRRF